jgi:trimeric autotransporter adhesin
VTAAAYTNSFAGTATSTLYVIDTANDRLMIQGRAPGTPIDGDLQVVGPLGITGDVLTLAGLDINAINNNAFAALNVGAATTSDLYSIDLTTGKATRIGPIASTTRIRSLTHSNVPQATLLGVTNDGRLLSFNVNTPATIASNQAITGLQGGERVLGFDIRPSNQVLYLLSDAGRIYTVDPVTARATLGKTLMPNVGDPFRALIGTTFGTDFSPTADALRVLSDAEHNLAVLVDTGATITATSLQRISTENGRPAPDVVAIAYTNNYPSPTDTTLYNIDLGSQALVTQKPANNGQLTTVGPLTANAQVFTFSGGFDIVGGDNGLAVAALQPMGSSQSTLYRVNLRTGALTAIGAIGAVDTMRLMGLTIRLQ